MAAKVLFTADLAAGVLTDLVPAGVPSGKSWSFSVNFCNRTSAPTNIRLAISTGGSPANSEYYEYNTEIPANGTIERTGLLAQATYRIHAWAADAGVSINGYGYEE